MRNNIQLVFTQHAFLSSPEYVRRNPIRLQTYLRSLLNGALENLQATHLSLKTHVLLDSISRDNAIFFWRPVYRSPDSLQSHGLWSINCAIVKQLYLKNDQYRNLQDFQSYLTHPTTIGRHSSFCTCALTLMQQIWPDPSFLWRSLQKASHLKSKYSKHVKTQQCLKDIMWLQFFYRS